MKKTAAPALIILLLCISASALSAQMDFRDKKYYGPIPLQNVNINFGFIDGPDATYLSDHFEYWAQQRNGSEVWEEIPTSPYFQIGYERRIAPRYFVTARANFSYLQTESVGNFFVHGPDSTYNLDIQRDLKIYLLSFDAGLKYYITEPKIQNLCPYVGGGFSAAIPMVRLTTDSYNYGRPFPNPDDEADKSDNDIVAGMHAEFGMIYFVTNRFSAGAEGRFQMCQSKFEIHGSSFDLKYQGFSLAVTLAYHF